ALDGVGLACVEQLELGIHARGGALHARQRVDDAERHALGGDAEESPAALGLRAPQAFGRHIDRAEAVLLWAGGGHAALNVKAGRTAGLRRPVRRSTTRRARRS